MNIITIVLTIILLIIALIFFIRSKLTGLIASSLRLAFILFFALSLVGIFLPGIYDTGADFLLRQAGVYNQITTIDRDVPIQDLLDAPGNVFDFFGGAEEDQEIDEGEVGFFENSIYPTFVSIFAFLLRIYSLIVSFTGLIAVVYLSYLSTTITDTENIKTKVRNMEARINQLETILKNSA